MLDSHVMESNSSAHATIFSLKAISQLRFLAGVRTFAVSMRCLCSLVTPTNIISFGVYWRAAFISLKHGICVVFIGGRCLLEGSVYLRKYSICNVSTIH